MSLEISLHLVAFILVELLLLVLLIRVCVREDRGPSDIMPVFELLGLLAAIIIVFLLYAGIFWW